MVTGHHSSSDVAPGQGRVPIHFGTGDASPKRSPTLLRVPADRVIVHLDGTKWSGFAPTFRDDEQATFHSISAAEPFANKSHEELRMEDYQRRPGGFSGDNTLFTDSQGSTVRLPFTKPVSDQPMDCETLLDDPEIAVRLTKDFFDIMEKDLATEEWSALASFVKPNWNTMKDQLYRVFLKRQEWKRRGAQCQLSVGYHFSLESQMSTIRQTGLLTQADRLAQGLPNNVFKAAYGDGVYTGNDPTTFYEFRTGANAGMMVLRLVGKSGRASSRAGCDTVVSCSRGIVNLRGSDQCAVLVEYEGEVVFLNKINAKSKILRLQTYFEGLIDRVLAEEPVPKQVVSDVKLSNISVHSKVIGFYRGMSRPRDTKQRFMLTYNAPQTLNANTSRNAVLDKVDASQCDSRMECVICRSESQAGQSTTPMFKIKACGHRVHQHCADRVLLFQNQQAKCPCCRKLFKEPRGASPSGSLTVIFDPHTGSPLSSGTIVLQYKMLWGIQKEYHVDRGKLYSSSEYEAFVPDCEAGRQLVQRLVYAFLRGLTFTIAPSSKPQESYRIAWSSIPHKTCTSSSDDFYIPTANMELDILGVPAFCDSTNLRSCVTTAETKELFDFLQSWRPF